MQDSTRRLIWIPIIHSQTDLGSLGNSVRNVYTRKLGAGKWHQHRRTVDTMWQAIRKEIPKLELDYARSRIYQDGLPNCGHETEIIADLARAGSLNHRIILDLMAQGAKVIGTESPDLLLEEYELAKQIFASAPSSMTNCQQELAKGLLSRRDRYIGERINQTLQPGETGILFLGMLHSLDGFLPSNIELVNWNHMEKSKTAAKHQRRSSR